MKELTVLQTATDNDSRFGSGGRAGEVIIPPLPKKQRGNSQIKKQRPVAVVAIEYQYEPGFLISR